MKIDLNADMGESFGAWRMGEDEALMTVVSSVNLACGFHAGDPLTMRRTVAMAVEAGVAIGAHPGYRDLVGFGRRKMELSAEEVTADLLYQLGALDAFVRAAGTRLHHVKPHGALYNQAAEEPELALAIAQAVRAFDPHLILVGRAGSALLQAGVACDLQVAGELFADRRYLPNGALAPRSMPGAVIDDPQEAAQQAAQILSEQVVTAIDGTRVSLTGSTLCIHGDRPHAAAFAQAVRERLEEMGIQIAPLRWSKDG